MNAVFRAVVMFTVAAILCAATFLLVPRLRTRLDESGGIELVNDDAEREMETDVPVSVRPKHSAASRAGQTRNPGGPVEHEEYELEEMSDVEEMTRDFEEMLQRFHGTPEERQEVIDECESGRELIRMIADLSESSIEKMSPEELEKERESFEKEYRAQLDLLRTGQLQSLLATQEEQEIIGSTVDAVQDFLERIDAALLSAGY